MEQNKKQSVVDWLIKELEEYIRKSAHNELGTARGSDFRIGLTKAIELCEQAKEVEKGQMEYMFECGRNFQLSGEGAFTQVYNETYGTK